MIREESIEPHIHAKEIVEWSKGHEIQYLSKDGNWYLCPNPLWNPYVKYRVVQPNIVVYMPVIRAKTQYGEGEVFTTGFYHERGNCVDRISMMGALQTTARIMRLKFNPVTMEVISAEYIDYDNA